MATALVALYARVSSAQQTVAHTIDSQLAALRAHLAAQGLTVPAAHEFIDDGYSGATLVRPALERLRDLTAAGGLDRLVVLAPDRLARKHVYLLVLLEEFAQAGVQVEFLNHPAGQTPEEQLLLQLQGMIAEYERATILERSRRGKLSAAQRGAVSVLSGAPYGYQYRAKQVDTPAQYGIVLAEAAVVRQIFEWIGVERVSLGEVARRLNQAEVPSRRGGRWTPATIGSLVRNPAYVGRAAFGKTHSTAWQPPLRPARGVPAVPRHAERTVRVPAAEWITVAVPPLVSEELFAAVAEQVAENAARARQSQRGARYLLQGLVVCGQCGYGYHGVRSQKAGQAAYSYYRCTGTQGHRFGGAPVCTNQSLRTEGVDAAVWEQVQAVLADPQRVAQEYAARLAGAGGGAERGAAEQLRQARSGVERLIDSYTEGMVTKEEFAPRLARLRERVAALEAAGAEQGAAAAAQAELRLLVGRLEEFAAQVRAGLAAADWATQRDLIRALVKRIEIGPERVTVVFRISPGAATPGPPADNLQHCMRSEHAYVRAVGYPAART